MKVIKQTILTFLIIVLSVVACKSDYRSRVYTPEKYVNWVKSHTQTWEKTAGGIHTYLEYIPSPYKMLTDYRGQTEEISDSIFNLYKELEYYKMTIGIPDATINILEYNSHSLQEYGARLEYFTGVVNRDIYIVSDKDTLFCSDTHLQRTYGLNKDITLLLAFPKSKKNEISSEQTFVYDERLFNLGKINFLQNRETLANYPTLRIR